MHLKLVHNIKYVVAVVIALFFLPLEGKCDRYGYLDTLKTRIQNLRGPASDTLTPLQDTLITGTDSTASDSLVNNSSLEGPIFSGGKDSIVKDFNVDGRKMIYYYGDVKVSYGDMEISSEYMAFDVDSKTVFAKGLPDTSGTVFGKPKMKQGEKTYEMESVYYNFNTEKAKIKNMITQEAEGFLHGTYIKKMPDNSINIAKGKYTTCDHEHPHFYLKMTTAKVIQDENGGQKTVFGPAYVVLEDVPTPFALPFGFVPKFGGRASGLLMPTYGEEAARGFFMRGLGYYFVFSDHFDVAATGDIYTMGSWAGQLNARYNKRYKYNGTLSIAYQNDQTGEKGQPDFFQTKNFSMQWSHSMDAKARPGTSFRASVNFSSPSYNQYNNQTNIQTALQNQISSSISYGKTWTGTPFSLSINALHSQNSRDSSYAVTLPNLTFTVNRIYPFRRKERVGKEKFYESFAFNYNTTLENKINFKAKEVKEPDFFKKMKNGMRHNFSISLPSFSVAKYIQASPSVTYGMNWYFTDCEKVFNQQTQKVETIYSDPFSTFGITQNFSAGLSLSTRLYGKFVFGKERKVEAIRHMVTPSISFSVQPEMGTTANGYTQLSYVDINGIQHSVTYNKYEGQTNSPPGRGKSASMSFSLGNNLEAKIRDRNDTTGTGVKKVKLIDQLSFGGSYNFLADSLNLSNISVNMNTTIFGKLGLNVNATFDPYAIDSHGKKINTFNIVKEGGFKLARLTNASASFSYSFSGEGKGRMGSDYKDPNAVTSQNSTYQRIYHNPVTGEYIPGGWVYYMSPEIPWSINMNYNYSYNRSYQYANEKLLTKHNHMMTLGLSGQLRLTDALNVNLNSGVDMMKMKLTTTQMSATYDLHCFSISVSWVPNGQWESWSFRINAKASALADLLQFKKNASYWDNRF
ncbi:MAG: LPS-assembly protein LptD [Bacteroidales bacterium]|nr:LPS-assembly protein LptD [Bacteroidales bacterium]